MFCQPSMMCDTFKGNTSASKSLRGEESVHTCAKPRTRPIRFSLNFSSIQRGISADVGLHDTGFVNLKHETGNETRGVSNRDDSGCIVVLYA